MSGSQALLAMPRTLMRTTMIERGIVRVEGNGAKVVPSPAATAASKAAATKPGAPELGSISAEQFFEELAKRDARAPAAVKALVAQLEPLGVYPDFRRSLNLRWDPPEGRTVNFGSIYRNGEIWTDSVNRTLPHALSHRYVETLAAAWGLEVERDRLGDGIWYVKGKTTAAPRITDVVDKLPAWGEIIGCFVIDAQMTGGHSLD